MRLFVLLILTVSLVASPQQARNSVRPITWDDAAPVRHTLEAAGLSQSSFAARIDAIRRTNARRVQEGDLDHLIFYLLQSTTFTKQPRLEPALSARMFVDTGEIPSAVRSRAAAFLRAVDSGRGDERLSYFRDLARATFTDAGQRQAALLREYERVMKFVYEKEFVAQRSEQRTTAVAELYRTRGLSTDTAVEAGFLVHQGLGVLRALAPDLRIRRVLIVGPGLDLAPRTSLREAGPPESYQPWAVMDALLSIGLSHPGDVAVIAADINPRVVQHLRRAHDRPPLLTLATEIRETGAVLLSTEYRDYFAGLGRAIGSVRPNGPLSKTVRVTPAVAGALRAETLDIVTERLTGEPVDLIVATNILPYFDDAQLALAMVNIAGMLAPGGTFLHNEARPSLGDLTSAVGLPLEHSRHAVIATVRGAPPLVDSVFLHRKARGPGGQGAGEPGVRW